MYQEENLEEGQECFDYTEDGCYDDYEYELLSSLQTSAADNHPYRPYELAEIFDQIWEENLQKCIVTSLPPAWNLMLYSFCEFSNEKLLNMIDQDQIGRNIVLRYNENYIPQTIEGQCPVCLEASILITNPCGHAFCPSCWNSYMLLHHADRNQYELFPNCQWEGCYHKTNYLLMEEIWRKFGENRAHFNKLLCLRYTQKSPRAILCISQNCSKAILMNYPIQSVVQCSCSAKICRFCKQGDHSPLTCGDLKVWTNILEAKEDLWMNEIITQKCPMCKTPIDKNGGCVHMTCICNYEFCWICLKVWKGHSSFYACSELTKESHEERLRDEQQKRRQNEGEYSERFQQAKCGVDRYNHIIKRLKELDLPQLQQRIRSFFNLHGYIVSDILRLKQIRSYLIQALSFELYSQIYIFFELPSYKRLREGLASFSKQNSQLDDYLVGKFKVLLEALAQSNKEVAGNHQEIQGLIAAIKLELILDRDQYNEMFKSLKRQHQILKSCSFMEK